MYTRRSIASGESYFVQRMNEWKSILGKSKTRITKQENVKSWKSDQSHQKESIHQWISILGVSSPSKIFKSFSRGLKFKSRLITLLLLLLDLLKTGITEFMFAVTSLKASALCFRMWPPKAWPFANLSPQIVHSCMLGVAVEPKVNTVQSSSFGSDSFGRLWLVRWPPNAWNDGNRRLQVLHSKAPPWQSVLLIGMVSTPRERNIRQFARSELVADTPLSKTLCMV